MKSFTKNIIKFWVVLTFVFAGASFANANFVTDPSTQGNGITSIGFDYSSANDENSIQVSIPNSGDTEEFYVFMDYQNSGNFTLTDVRARLTYSGSSAVTFIGKLTSGNGGSAQDTALLYGLPSSWDIELLSSTKVNTHGAYCGSQYEYNTTISGLTSSNGALIGTLDTTGISQDNGYTGACSQGHVVAKFRITNTTTTNPTYTYSWETGDWGSCINGVKERDVFCVNDQTGTTVNDSYCDAGNEPASTSTSGCSDNTSLDVDTLSATNVDTDSATLNGDLITGGPADQYWFVISSTTSNPSCSAVTGVQILYPNAANGEIGGGSNPTFHDTAAGLSSDTTYYYRACASEGNDTASGQVLHFTTDDIDNGGSSDTPQADTEGEDNVDEDSAELNGRIKMNDFDNGIVFFVYGQDEDRIDSTESDYDRYNEANDDEDGDDFQVVLVDNDNDDNDWQSYNRDVYGLDTDERYYYQICVEYYDGGDELECGGVEEFETDDDYNNNNDDVDIETLAYDDVGITFATLCGDLQDDGGDHSIRTRIEFRRSNGGSWVASPWRQRGEGRYCEEVNNLQPDTQYQYRACADSGDCGNVRNFRTNGFNVAPVAQVNVNTLPPTYVNSNSAILNGSYQGSAGQPTQVWFEWGRTQTLGTRKQTFTKSALAGTFSDSFTGLRSCTTYYYRAVAQNGAGIKYGNIYSFKTGCVINTGGPQVVQPPVITVVEEVEDETIDLDLLGLGLSLIRLDIDNEQEVLYRDQVVQYEVRWENISTIDLDDIDLKVTMPQEITVTGTSRGRFDADENVIFYNIEDLDEGESGSLTVTGIVNEGRLGDVITAEAAAAYDNPINRAQENATDYDIDEFVLNTNFGTASVFGLSNITFLGWLTILLGLLIIFLIARWLYLDREELRAQAYANGYRPNVYGRPQYDTRPQSGFGYQEPYEAPRSMDDGYQPYRPNRG